MTKTILLATILWFCAQPLYPQLIRAQTERDRAETKAASETETPPQKMPVSSETEVSSTEAAEEAETHRRIVQMGGDFHLRPTETVNSLILIGGNAIIQGHATGDILVLKGDVEIKEGAQISGKVTAILGKIKGKEFLEADRQRYEEINGWRLVPASTGLMMRPQEAWGMGKPAKLGWSVLVFITLTVVYILLLTAFPQQIDNMAYIISHRPIGSTLFGLVVLVAVPYLTMVLVLSIVGIPLVLLLFSILLPMAIYGKTAIFLSMGNAIFSQQPKVVAVIAGYWIYFMATAIPHIDRITFLVANTIGIGVCIRTVFGRKSIHSPRPTSHRRYPVLKYR